MKSQKSVLILEITLCMFVVIVLLLVAQVIYAEAFHIGVVVFMLPNWIVVTLIYWKKEIKTGAPRFRWFTFLLIGITLAAFIFFKPNITYSQGKEIVTSQGFENIYELQDKSITSFRLKQTYLVPEAYLYAGEKNNVKYYILLSPLDGVIETEKMGEGNYLDFYFEMKYER